MGLLYLFPIQEDEGDHVSIKDSSLLLKSYGLPYLFWGYLLAGLTTLGIITLAIRGPLKKMLLYEDSLNVTAHTSNFIEGKVTAVPLDEIGRRQRGATEACFLHVAESDEADDCQDRQGGEQLPLNFFLGALTLFTRRSNGRRLYLPIFCGISYLQEEEFFNKVSVLLLDSPQTSPLST